jgi:hypothetical protein
MREGSAATTATTAEGEESHGRHQSIPSTIRVIATAPDVSQKGMLRPWCALTADTAGLLSGSEPAIFSIA